MPRTILLVDDEKSIHAFLKYVLTKRGHQVDGALSGVLALEKVQGILRHRLQTSPNAQVFAAHYSA